MNDLFADIEDFIDGFNDGAVPDATLRDPNRRDALLLQLAQQQYALCEPFCRLVDRRGNLDGLDTFPAMPTDAFRTLPIISFSLEQRTPYAKTFLTSGTTSGQRGRHEIPDTTLYEAAVDIGTSTSVFLRKNGQIRARTAFNMVGLCLPPEQTPESSLAFMLQQLTLHTAPFWAFDERGEIDHDGLARALEHPDPTWVCGTSFAWMQFLDSTDRSFQLPVGSVLMQTGGFKGKSRELDAVQMRQLLSGRMGVPLANVVSEYSMTELSSQLWGNSIITGNAVTPELLWAPSWVRVTARDPATLERLPDGQKGILRIDDLANFYSCAFIQTSDFGIVHQDGVELCGRDPNAVPRGCSLAIEEMLGS